MSDTEDPAGDFIEAVLTDLEAARRQFANDPSVLQRTKIGSPIMHWMVIEDFQLGVLRVIENFSPDLEHRDQDGMTPLHKAAFSGRLGAARILLEHGADPNAVDEHGQDNALHIATFGKHLDVVLVLLQYGAKADYSLGPGTDIFSAMSTWEPKVRSILLHALAQLGVTPVSFMREHGLDELYDSPEEAFGW